MLALETTAVLPCAGALADEPAVVTLAVGDWLGLGDGVVTTGGGGAGGGGAGAAVVGTGPGTDET